MTPTSKPATPVLRLLAWANHSPRIMLFAACSAMLWPALRNARQLLDGDSGANPLDVMIRMPGRWALILLLLTLAIAPFRHAAQHTWKRLGGNYGKRLSDWNWVARLRRPIALTGFFYALVHVGLYLVLDVGLDWTGILADLRDKPYIACGSAAFVLMAPLAITSTDGWMRRLRRNWKRLHLLVYPASVIAVLHFILLSKPGVNAPYVYGSVLGALFIYRLAFRSSQVVPVQDRIDAAVAERGLQGDQRKAPEPRRAPPFHQQF